MNERKQRTGRQAERKRDRKKETSNDIIVGNCIFLENLKMVLSITKIYVKDEMLGQDN